MANMDNGMEGPQNTKNRTNIWFNNSKSGFLFKESDNTNCARYMLIVVLCISQDMKVKVLVA